MTWETNYTDVVSKSLTTKLCTKTNLVSLFQEFVLKVDITESTTSLVACCRQIVVVLDAGEFYCEEVLLSRSTTNNESNMIRRASSCTKALHLFYEEWQQSALVLDGSLCHRIEVSLVGRTTTLGNHYEAILITLCCLDVNLSREVATSVHLIIHVERSILRVAEVVLCIGIVYTKRESLFVFEACPHLLTLLAMDDSGTSILAEWQYSLSSSLGIAEELESYILVVFAYLRVGEDSCNLLVVSTTEHKLAIVESLLSKQGQSLFADFQNLMTFEVGCADSFFRKQTIFCIVLAHLKHWGVLKFWCFSHSCIYIIY